MNDSASGMRSGASHAALVQEIDASPIHDHYVGSLAAREARRYRLR